MPPRRPPPISQGELEVDPATGVVRVTNAHPANRAGETYSVTVTAYNAGGATTKTFNLTVTTPPVCGFDPTTFTPLVNYTTGLGPSSAAVGDFNADGRQDIVTANTNNTASRFYSETRPTPDLTRQ